MYRASIILFLIMYLPSTCFAEAKAIDWQKRFNEKKLINEYVKGHDSSKIMSILKHGEFPSQEQAAKILGDWGIKEALPELEKLNGRYANFICRSSGVFGVAIVKIQTHDKHHTRKVNALLKLALKGKDGGSHRSCSSEAARELGKLGDKSVLPGLKKLNSYGSVEAVVRLETQHLSDTKKIRRYMTLIKEHKTPQLRTAGEVLISEMKHKVLPDIVSLLGKTITHKPKEGAPPWTNNYRIARSCLEVLEQIGGFESIDAIAGRLNDPHPVVSIAAMNMFQRLVGQDCGFNIYKADNENSISEALKWWSENKHKYKE